MAPMRASWTVTVCAESRICPGFTTVTPTIAKSRRGDTRSLGGSHKASQRTMSAPRRRVPRTSPVTASRRTPPGSTGRTPGRGQKIVACLRLTCSARRGAVTAAHDGDRPSRSPSVVSTVLPGRSVRSSRSRWEAERARGPGFLVAPGLKAGFEKSLFPQGLLPHPGPTAPQPAPIFHRKVEARALFLAVGGADRGARTWRFLGPKSDLFQEVLRAVGRELERLTVAIATRPRLFVEAQVKLTPHSPAAWLPPLRGAVRHPGGAADSRINCSTDRRNWAGPRDETSGLVPREAPPMASGAVEQPARREVPDAG